MDIRIQLSSAQELYRLGQTSEAERIYRVILKRSPNHPEALFFLGVILLKAGNARKSVPLFRTVVKAAPNNPIAHDHFGQALLATGKTEAALDSHRRAVSLAPNSPECAFNLAIALEAANNLQEAESAYRGSLTLSPNFFPALANLGALLYSTGRYYESEELLRRALKQHANAPEPLANLIAVLERTHRTGEAASLTDVLSTFAPNHPAVFLPKGRQKKRQGEIEEAITQFKKAATANIPSAFIAEALWEQGRIFDQAGCYREAFQAFQNCNDIYLSSAAFAQVDKNELPRRIREYRERFSQKYTPDSGLPTKGELPRTFFFVGFPRSGTTLMEQVFSAHKKLETTNENSPLNKLYEKSTKLTGCEMPRALSMLNNEQLQILRREFLDDAREVTQSKLTDSYLVDKMPMHIVELGPIEFLFPNATAIVALRDPRDVCLSCFMQRFAINDGMVHFLTLESTVRFYANVMELWLHYRKTLTIPWIEYRYEDLVNDFEGTIRGVLEFMDIQWDNSVLRYAEHARGREIRTPSYGGVTQPIYSGAVSRWRNYADQFDPLLPILEPFVKEFGYEPS